MQSEQGQPARERLVVEPAVQLPQPEQVLPVIAGEPAARHLRGVDGAEVVTMRVANL